MLLCLCRIIPIFRSQLQGPVRRDIMLYSKTMSLRVIYNIVLNPGSSEVPRNSLTRWDVSSIPAKGIFFTKKKKKKKKNAQRVQNDSIVKP